MTRKRYILEKYAVAPLVTGAVRFGAPTAMRFLNLAFNRFSRGAGKMLSTVKSVGTDVGKAITAPPNGFVQPQNISSRLKSGFTSGGRDFGQGFKHVGKAITRNMPLPQNIPRLRPVTPEQWYQEKEKQPNN